MHTSSVPARQVSSGKRNSIIICTWTNTLSSRDVTISHGHLVDGMGRGKSDRDKVETERDVAHAGPIQAGARGRVAVYYRRVVEEHSCTLKWCIGVVC